MADQNPHGQDWKPEEIELIVSDYFAMLNLELAGRSYIKAEHNRGIQALTGRSHGSVEMKHQNISAVLSRLGVPWINGYKPLPNYQGPLLDALEHRLNGRPDLLQWAPDAPMPRAMAETGALIETLPPALIEGDRPPPAMERLARKFDPGARDFRNRLLGKAGEALVVERERRWLHIHDRSDLAEQVRWVADLDGDGAGYDVLSFAPSGERRLIEVKTTTGDDRTPFFLTRNEEALSRDEPDAFCIFRLYEFRREPKFFELRPPLNEHVMLDTETWRAGFG